MWQRAHVAASRRWATAAAWLGLAALLRCVPSVFAERPSVMPAEMPPASALFATESSDASASAALRSRGASLRLRSQGASLLAAAVMVGQGDLAAAWELLGSLERDVLGGGQAAQEL